MPDVSFDNLAVVLGVAFLAPLILGLAPWLRVPSIVLEIGLGIVVGPSLLGWAKVDEPVAVLATIGLAFLLFLTGFELDLNRLQGDLLTVSAIAFLFTLAFAAIAGYALRGFGLVNNPLLAAVVLTGTSLGLVFPVLEESGQLGRRFGTLVIAGASIGEFAGVIILSLIYSRDATGAGTRLFLLTVFVATVGVVAFALTRRSRSLRISRVLRRLQDSTAQIRIRGAVFILGLLVMLAAHLGLEAILGAFVAGVLVGVVDRNGARNHPQFHVKLEAIGYGFLIPAFFVTSGISFDLNALTAQPSTLARIPVFLAALLAARGLPALICYRHIVGTRGSAAAGLLQATSLPLIVAATQIGVATGAISRTNAAAFVAAGLLSALAFPVIALGLLHQPEHEPKAGDDLHAQQLLCPSAAPWSATRHSNRAGTSRLWHRLTIVIEGGPHAIPWTHADQVNSALRKFLS
jgi:Kef-type K+ transport system membrane component KefB